MGVTITGKYVSQNCEAIEEEIGRTAAPTPRGPTLELPPSNFVDSSEEIVGRFRLRQLAK